MIDGQRERRKFVRFNAPFYIHCARHLDSAYTAGVSEDLSYGGARIVVDKPLTLGQQSEVDLFLLVPGMTIKIPAGVVWSGMHDSKQRFGLCFSHLPDSYKKDLYDCIYKYHPQAITYRWWEVNRDDDQDSEIDAV